MSPRVSGVLSAVLVVSIGLPIVLWRNSPASSGLATTVEVQEFDQLWEELRRLQAAKLDAAGFQKRFVRRTAKYLQLVDGAEELFADVARKALLDLNAARARMQKLHAPTGSEAPSVERRREAWRRWQEDQRRASDRLLGACEQTPRHRLFTEQRLLWLLRLDYSVRAVGEAPDGQQR